MGLHFIICICTYNRPQLLRKLLTDLDNQTEYPRTIIIVDGNPGTEEVKRTLISLLCPQYKLVYIPSNHANLSYQRYLGWNYARQQNPDILLYLDDDLRIPNRDGIKKMIQPLAEQEEVVGVTTSFIRGDVTQHQQEGIWAEHRTRKNGTNRIVSLLGPSKNVANGDISPNGNKRPPEYSGRPYGEVAWLSGGVMAYRMDALMEDCFTEDLFALDQVRCGLGEDTILSRRVGTRGKLLYCFDTQIEHPNEDTSKAYPTKAFKYGHAIAYSRRFMNDHYIPFGKPTFSHRFALGRSYLGNFLVNWLTALAHPRSYRFAYAAGYTVGALRGVFISPIAKNLTPQIDWQADAGRALAQVEVIGG